MPIMFFCSTCGKKHSAPGNAAGKTGQCSCGARLQVPMCSTDARDTPPYPMKLAQQDADSEIPDSGCKAESQVDQAERLSTCERDSLPDVMPVWKEILLWIAVLPGAALGSTIVFWVMNILVWLGSSRYGNDSWFFYIYKEVLTNAACGVAWVYYAGYIAPRGKIAVAITFATLLLFVSGFTFFLALLGHEWMSLLGIVCLNAGAIITSVCVTKGSRSY